MKRLIAILLGAALAIPCVFSRPAWATLTDTSNGRRVYTGDGSTHDFSFIFPVQKKEDVGVTVTLSGVPQSVGIVTVTINVDQLNSPGGNVNISIAPPNTSVVTLQRNQTLTQNTKMDTYPPPKTVEKAFDAAMMRVQQVDRRIADQEQKEIADISNVIAGGISGANLLAPIATGENTSITLADRFSYVRNVRGMGAVANGSTDDSVKIQNTMNLGKGIVYMPPSSNCYNIGTTTLSVPNNVILMGAGRGSGGTQGASCVKYTGTGCAILFDSVQSAGVMNFDLRVDTSSATAAGICIKDTGGVNTQFLRIEGMSVFQVNATRRVAGQVGIYAKVTGGNGIYWSTIQNNRLQMWDIAIRLQGCTTCAGGTVQGANENQIFDNMSWGHNIALQIDTNSVDNNVNGIKCSRSDASMVGTQTCAIIGDNTNNSAGNFLWNVMSDQGSPSVCATIGSAVSSTVMFANCQSGLLNDNNATAFPSFIYTTFSGPTVSKLSVGQFQAKSLVADGPFRFATYTSCTTAAAAGATCTSGPAGISPAFPDTNYRISCTMNNIAGIPRIIGVTKTSGSAFTLTIEAGTAVAAGGNFDCILMHL